MAVAHFEQGQAQGESQGGLCYVIGSQTGYFCTSWPWVMRVACVSTHNACMRVNGRLMCPLAAGPTLFARWMCLLSTTLVRRDACAVHYSFELNACAIYPSSPLCGGLLGRECSSMVQHNKGKKGQGKGDLFCVCPCQPDIFWNWG